MDIFDPINIIKYSCACERFFTLPELYYCNGCQKNACKYCVTEEIDSYYCPNCLENLASAEALLNHNRCKKCYECPLCFSAMTYNVNNDVYFLNCASCHWNSLSIGMTADNPYTIKKETDKTQQQEYTKTLEIVQREAREIANLKDKNRPLGRRRLPTRQSLLSPPSLSSVGTSQTRVPITPQDVDKQQEEKYSKMVSFSVVEEDAIVDTIPDHLYSITDLNQVTTLPQQLANLSITAPFLQNLVPVKKLLHTRRSKRCRKCDQLLVKPDLNFEIAKVEFKRLRVAYAIIPRVMVAKPMKIETAASPSSSSAIISVELYIINPLPRLSELSFSLLPLPHHTAQVTEVPPATFIPGNMEEEDEYDAELKERIAADNQKFIARRSKNKLFLVLQLSMSDPNVERIKFGIQANSKFTDTAAGEQDTTFKLDFDFENKTTTQ